MTSGHPSASPFKRLRVAKSMAITPTLVPPCRASANGSSGDGVASKPHRPLVQRPHETGLAGGQGGPHPALRVDGARYDHELLLQELTRRWRDGGVDAVMF